MVGVVFGIRRWIDPALVIGDLAQDVPDATFPARLRPVPAQLNALASGLGRGVHVFRGVDEIQDRLEVGEVTTLDRPVIRQAVADEGLGRGGEEAAPVRGGSRHPTERLAVIQGGQPGADHRDRSPVRFLGRGRRFTRRWQLDSRSQRSSKARGEVRLWIDVGYLTLHPQQDGRLGLPPSRLVDPRPVVGLAHLNTTAIDHDGGQLDRRIRGRRRRHQRAIFIGRRPLGLLIDSDASLFLAERLEVAG